MSETGLSALLEGIGSGEGFRVDPRYSGVAPAAPPPSPEEPLPDPLASAWAEGFAAGEAHAREEALASAKADAEARDRLALSFARLDATLEEELRVRLRDTVAALCEAALAPYALDEDALVARVGKAVAMLARADDDRVIRLHPEDLPLVAPRLSGDWVIQPDATLERGGLRVETASGGVEDGPEQWRRALDEALSQC